jgi:hypothetical protein
MPRSPKPPPANDGRDPATGRFVVGNRVNPDGRPARQRETRDLKRAILDAAEDAGLEIDPTSKDGLRSYLGSLAKSHQKTFGPLLARALPLMPTKLSTPLPDMAAPSSVVEASNVIARAASEGDITLAEAASLSAIIANVAKLHEAAILAEKVAAIEAQLAAQAHEKQP